MKTRRLHQFLAGESGQVLPAMVVVLVVLLSVMALAMDVGRAYYAQRKLQSATDAAALAAAQAMLNPNETPKMIIGKTNQGNADGAGVGGVAGTYSAAPGGYNASSLLPNVTETATLECYDSLKSLGQPCVGTVPYNAVQVRQTAVLSTFFAGILGKPSLTLTSTATASARGGSPKPTNVAIILDTTLSELATDSNCTVNGVQLTEMQCSLNGLQVLLQALQPCGINQTTCSPSNGVAVNSFDRVSLFTFPNVTTASVAQDTSCTSSVPTASSQNGYWNSSSNGSTFTIVMPVDQSTGQKFIAPYAQIATAASYTFPTVGASSYQPIQTPLVTYPTSSGLATYQITGFLSDYRLTNNSTTLNTSSALVKAAGAVSSCGGLAPSNYDGVFGTYYAGVIYAAQAALVAQKTANPGSDNVIILISDGDSTAPGGYNWGNTFPMMPDSSTGVTNPASASGQYPSWKQECSQAVTAASYASSQGTTVYTVAYGSKPTGCASDTSPTISPCDAMAAMASAPQEFYSDWKQSGSGSTCVASQPVTSISDIFASIANDLTKARLIPNNTT